MPTPIFSPNASSLPNVYDNNGNLSKQWSSVGGITGNENGKPFVQCTSTPSFFGAPNVRMFNASFGAKIDVAPVGNGTTYTRLMVKKDEINYAEIYVDSERRLRANVVNDNIPEIMDVSKFPAYDSIAHAYWRITQGDNTFRFWYSADAVQWFEFGSARHLFSPFQVTIMFLAGFSGINTSGNRAYITVVNASAVPVPLSSTVRATTGVTGTDTATDVVPVKGAVSGISNASSKFKAVGGLPEGGMTDMGISSLIDPAQLRYNRLFWISAHGGPAVTWARPDTGLSFSPRYRDGSYWPNYSNAFVKLLNPSAVDNNIYASTMVQMEQTTPLSNRLSVNSAYYTDSCEYVPQMMATDTGNGGSISVTRSADRSLVGDYSGKMVFGGIPSYDNSGRPVYYPYPTVNSLVPLRQKNGGSVEAVKISVYLNTDRAGTQWYPYAFVYDGFYNTYSSAPVDSSQVFTHPGGGVWQKATVTYPSQAGGTLLIGVVPVVVSAGSPETVYMSGHSITTINPDYVTASPYQDARKTIISLKADRVNHLKNAGFNSTVRGWWEDPSQVTANPTIADTFTRTLNPTVTDSFTRTVSNGWGTADTGQTWSTAGGSASDYSVSGGTARSSVGVVNSSRFTFLSNSVVDTDVAITITVPVLAIGSDISTGLRLRAADTSNYYYVETMRKTDGTFTIGLVSRVAAVSTQIAGPVTLGTYTAGQSWRLRARIVGTVLQAKAWPVGSVEPDLWQVWAVTSSITAANPVGTRAILSTGNTNTLPVVVSYDDFVEYTVSQGWGTSTTGQAWTTVGGASSDFSIDSGEGTIALTTVDSSRKVVIGSAIADSVQTVTVQTPIVALTDSIDLGLVSRYQDSNNYYHAVLHFHNDSTVDLRIRKVVAGVYTTMVIGPAVSTYSAGSRMTIKFLTQGNTLSAKAWRTGDAEPTSYTSTTVDTSLPTAGQIGVRANLQQFNTNILPVNTTFDNYSYLPVTTSDLFSLAWDGTKGYNSLGSMKVSVINPGTSYSGNNFGPVSATAFIPNSSVIPIDSLKIGETYTLSARVFVDNNGPNVTMRISDANRNLLASQDVFTVRSTNPGATTGGWTLLTVTFTIPTTSTTTLSLAFTTTISDATTFGPFNYWVDSILLEKGSVLLPYFDGSSGSTDYQYEKQTTNVNTRSYYYKNFTNKLARLNQSINNYVPLGNTVSILSAQTP